MPSQFSFQVSVEVGDDLKQIGSELKALTLEASQRAEEAGGNGIMAGLATAADHLGRNAHLLKSHFQSQTSQSKSHAKELGKYFRKHGPEFVAAGARKSWNRDVAASADDRNSEKSTISTLQSFQAPQPGDISVEASVEFTFCITPLQCYGS